MLGPETRGVERHLGIDLGASEVKIALCTPDGARLHKARRPSRGHPLAVLLRALEEMPDDRRQDYSLKVAVTGSGQPLLEGLAQCLPVNEVVATALAVRQAFGQARTVIDLGGQFSKWILLGKEREPEAAVLDFASNGLCAAGGGAFLEQQACRLGLTLDRLGAMAATARRGATIAGRCSVFAKSDMIHLQQKGTPSEEIAFGLCEAMVRTFVSTVMQGRKVEPPVVLVGGGAANPGLVRAFRERFGLPDDQLFARKTRRSLARWEQPGWLRERPARRSSFSWTCWKRARIPLHDAPVQGRRFRLSHFHWRSVNGSPPRILLRFKGRSKLTLVWMWAR